MNSVEAWLYKAKNDLKLLEDGDALIMVNPDIYLEPDYDEVYEAIDMAREIFVFVKEKIRG